MSSSDYMAQEGWEYDGIWDWTTTLQQFSHPHSASLIRQCDPELAEENTKAVLPQLRPSRSAKVTPAAPAGDEPVPDHRSVPKAAKPLERKKSRFTRCLPSMFRRQDR